MTHLVHVQRVVSGASLPSDEAFADWVDAALQGESGQVELTIRIVGKAESRRLNARYRGIDRPTNVLSFAAGLEADIRELVGGALPLGDLVICAPVLRAEAQAQGKPERDHWAHLVVHGILHLLGMDHQTGEQAEVMEGREIDILAGLGVPDPYADDGTAHTDG